MTTTVHDNKTDREYVYSLSPKHALVCAYYQYALNNWRTYEYDYTKWDFETEGTQLFFKPPGQTHRKRFSVPITKTKKTTS